MIEKLNNLLSLGASRTSLMLFLSLCLCLSLSPLSAQKKKKQQPSIAPPTGIMITYNEMSRYRIVVPSAAPERGKKCLYDIAKLSASDPGAALPIIAARKHRGSYEIVLGQNERLPC